MIPIRSWLSNIGLWFTDPVEEYAFFQTYVLNRKSLIQAAILSGSILNYAFFLWDRVIDPQAWETTQMIRGVIVTPLIWLAGLLLFVRKLDPWAEGLLFSAIFTCALSLPVIYMILHNGFDYGAEGVLFIVLFACALAPMRVPFFAALCLLTWFSFDVLERISGNYHPGMPLVNDLCSGTAILLAMFSVVSREYSARREFRLSRELTEAEGRMGELQQSNKFLRGQAHRYRHAHDTNIVISYRRIDSDAIAGRIRDRLVAEFGEKCVFMDIDSIPCGSDFREHIQIAMRDTQLVLAVIGPAWLAQSADGRSRVMDADDPVRAELEMALERKIPILPVLVAGAVMPSAASLPQSLRELSFRNAAVVDSGRDFHLHVDRLIRSMDQLSQIPHSAASAVG